MSRYDKPDVGRARRSVDQHTVLSMRPFFAAPRARLAWRPGSFVTNSREYRGLVFSGNVVARRLWTKLGFIGLDTIPGVVRKNDGAYQGTMSMFRSLRD